MTDKDSPAPARAAYPIKDFAARHGIGLTKTYAEIAAGRLVARKVGTRTLIFQDDEIAWRDSLPRLNAQAVA
jgi:hypothetical protein